VTTLLRILQKEELTKFKEIDPWIVIPFVPFVHVLGKVQPMGALSIGGRVGLHHGDMNEIFDDIGKLDQFGDFWLF
jgi:hypothetical protein